MVEIEFLSSIPIFSSLKPEDLEKLAGLWKPVTKNEKQVVFKKGDPGQSMYLIRDGKVAISVWNEDNQEVILSLLHEGDFFGELALFEGSPRTASAKVVENAQLLEMTREDFLRFLRSRPEVAITMLGVIGQRLRATNQMMERRTTRNVNEEIEQRLSFGDHLADRLAQMGGSWSFIIWFVGLIILWMALNTIQLLFQPFDPYPYIFLNFTLSFIGALQAPVIMMSQNRQTEKDRLHADLDYQVNLKAEMQIQSLHIKMDELRASEIHELLELQRAEMGQLKQQMAILEKLFSQKS